MTDSAAVGPIDTASAGVQDLARAATSVLDQAGPAGDVAKPVVHTLRNTWEGYFGSPIPPDGTNWNAYSHEQLYAMLWDSADVADVGAVADEWGRHSTELTGHADSMHRQRTAMQGNWNSESAGLATDRLGRISEQTSNTAEQASTVQRATQDAGDALSVARNTMPPPPGDPTGAVGGSAVAGAGAGAVVGGVVGAAAGGVGAVPGALMGAAVGAVAAGGTSMFVASADAAAKKAEAVHVMQQYEANLLRSSAAIAPPGVATAGAGPAPAATSAAGFGGLSGSSGGVPWAKLVGGHPLGGPGAGFGGVPGASGSMAGLTGLAGRGTPGGAMAPSRAGTGSSDEDEVHENRMPTIDQELFKDERPASAPVIG